MAQNQPQPQMDDYWSPFKMSQLMLYGIKVAGGKSAPTARPMVTFGGNVKFAVFKNDGGDTGAMEFSLGQPGQGTPLNFYGLLGAIEKVAKDRSLTGVQRVFKCSTWFGRDKTRLEKPQPVHAIIVARDEKGRVALWFQMKSADPIQFPFAYPPTNTPHHGNGERIDPVDESEEVAMAWCKMYEHIMASFMAVTLRKPAPKPSRDRQDSYGGSGGGNRQVSQTYTNTSEDSGGLNDFADDLPY